MNWWNRLTAQPERALAYLCCAQIAFWTLAPSFSHSAPPLDQIEGLTWGREGVIAAYKHPDLPGLILEGLRRLTGAVGWPGYFISQISIALTFWAVFELGRDLMDARRALAGTALLTGVYFFSWVTPEFNHNVLQMPFWAAFALFLWRAIRDNKLWQWAAFGLVAGFSLWAKYSSVVILLPAAIWMLWDADARRRLLSPGPYVALLLFAASVAPQALWLVQHDFQPLHYVEDRTSVSRPAWEFFAAMAAYHLPFLLLLLIAGWFGKAEAEAPQPPERRALRYLLLMGIGPLAATVLVAAVGGAGLRASWGAPMFNLSGLIAVALLSNRTTPQRVSRALAGAGVLIVLVSGLYYADIRYGAQLTGKLLKANWPERSLTRGLEAAWARETGNSPLRIVIANTWPGGLVGISDPRPPSVLIHGDFALSPWVAPQDLDRYGALVVWQEGDDPPPQAHRGNGVISHLYLRSPGAPNARPIVINYVILYPEPPTG